MNVTIAGNFGVTEGSMQPGFQHAGTWYDFFSGKAFNVTSTSMSVALAPGEFHIYVDQPVEFPERGLVKVPVDIYTPTNLVAEANTDYSVSLSWDDNSVGEDGHVIERRAQLQREFQVVGEVDKDVAVFTDTSTVDGVTYEYRVQVLSTLQPDSAYSNVASVNLTLAAPTGLSAQTINKKTITVSWEDNSRHELAYIIERNEQQGHRWSGFRVVGLLPRNTENFSDRDVKRNAQYQYRVRARDLDEYSAYSNVATPGTATPTGDKSVISMYPNAASSTVTISLHETDETVQVKIYSLQGVLLQSLELNRSSSSALQIDVSTWREGLYIVESRSGDAQFREQLIIKR
jgi:hypothetical protein